MAAVALQVLLFFVILIEGTMFVLSNDATGNSMAIITQEVAAAVYALCIKWSGGQILSVRVTKRRVQFTRRVSVA